ncbi:MAG TPA: SpoIIE family protein phosphatase [Rhodocyclaceae bacterium]|nr:SpoIIE family protein phosphatase [Rhodocyclaceae bacterium]
MPAQLTPIPRPTAAAVLVSTTRQHLAASLLLDVPSVTPAQTNKDVFALFDQSSAIVGLPVVEDGQPIGLINRNIFMDSFARPFHRELYGNKSCIAFMDKKPLVVDGQISLQELSFLALDHGGKTLADGFIITIGGRYAGMGTGQDMVRALSNLQAEKNRLVMESIDYASVIQRSFLRPSQQALRASLPDHFLVWEPRDVVGGDYFHFQAFDEGFFFALFDCTGHGVPGAFMTLIVASFLENALNADNRRDPGAVLVEVNRRVKTALGQIADVHGGDETGDEEMEHRSDDGMDAAFCWFDSARRELTYAGAHSPLLLRQAGESEVRLIEGDRLGVGYAATPLTQTWRNQSFTLAPGATVYLCTDGIVDQLGGPKRIAFGKKRLCQLLLTHGEQPMAAQKAVILDTLAAYQDDEPRRDDVSMFGFRT